MGDTLFFTHTFEGSPILLKSLCGRPWKKNPKPSKAPKRPLVVDLVDHTLTLPKQVIGYTIELRNEEGEVYTYYIIDTVFKIPQELHGTLGITISNGNSKYQGTIEVQS